MHNEDIEGRANARESANVVGKVQFFRMFENFHPHVMEGLLDGCHCSDLAVSLSVSTTHGPDVLTIEEREKLTTKCSGSLATFWIRAGQQLTD